MGRGRAPPQLFAIGLGFSFLLGLVLLCVGLGFYVPELQKESEYVTLSSCSITSYREQDYDCSYESCGSCRRRLGEGTEAQRKSEGAATVAAAAASPKTEPRRRLDECCHWVEQTCTNYFYGLGYVFPTPSTSTLERCAPPPNLALSSALLSSALILRRIFWILSPSARRRR